MDHDGLIPHRQIGLDEVRNVLLDTAGSPLSICVPPRASTVTGHTATVASFLMQPALGEMRVAMMPHAGADYVRYTLAADASANAERPTADA